MSETPILNSDASYWSERRTFSPDGSGGAELRERKRAKDLTVSVVLPVLRPSSIEGPCASIVRQLVGRNGLVDEVVVLDATENGVASTQAERAGARAVDVRDVLPEIPSSRGWGDAIWRSLYATFGDIVVWLRAPDIRPSAVVRLLDPLMREESISFVRGFHSLEWVGDSVDVFVRPALNELFPELSGFRQPFRGSSAGRGQALSQLPFMTGSGADLAILIDLLDLLGIDRMAQVDLGPAAAEDATTEPHFPTAPVARILLRRGADRGRIGTTPSAAVGALLAFAASDQDAVPESEHLPMHFIPVYVHALRRHPSGLRRQPIHAALAK